MTVFGRITKNYIRPVRTIGIVAAAFLGGYLFTWGLVALLISALVYLGGDFHNAENVGFLLAFPIFLLMFFWVFISQRTWLTYTTTFVGGTLMTAIAYGLQTLLVQ